MISVTIRVLEGMEQGRIYAKLQLPVSIGREEENDIQLNDDHISRFHAKLQVDLGRVILTDLESTNGTKVNGHWIHMRILQVGDVISVGRCILLLTGYEDDELTKSKSDPDPFRTAYVPAGATVEELAKQFSSDPSSAKGGAYGCYAPSNSSYASVRTDVTGTKLNTFPKTYQVINYNGTEAALFVAPTKRTVSSFASAASAVAPANSASFVVFLVLLVFIMSNVGKRGQIVSFM